MSNEQQDDKHIDEGDKGVSRRALIGAAGSLGLAAATLTAGIPTSAEAQSRDGCHFALEIPDFFAGRFQEVRGIGSETLEEDNRYSLRWGDITLKRGTTSSMDLYDWRKMVEDGQIAEARKSGSIAAYDQTHAEVARWNFQNAWPSKVESGGSSSAQNEAPSRSCIWESVTLRVEALTRVR
jgi:phage tail-like protein